MDENIAGWSTADLRRFIVNTILTDPGAYPKEKPKEPECSIKKIADFTAVGGSPTWDVTFDGAGYTHARVYFDGYLESGVAQGFDVRFNNDSGGNYWYDTVVAGGGTISAEANSIDGTTLFRAGVIGSTNRSMYVMDIGYAFDPTVGNKLVSVQGIYAGSSVRNAYGYWYSANTSIRHLHFMAANNIIAGSRCTVYGIK